MYKKCKVNAGERKEKNPVKPLLYRVSIERETGLEPAASTLARSRSTN